MWEKERVLKIFGPPNPDPASQKTAAKNSCDFPNLLRSLFRALIQGLTELPSFSHAGLNNKGEIFIFYRRNQFSEKRKSFCVCEIAACVCVFAACECVQMRPPPSVGRRRKREIQDHQTYFQPSFVPLFCVREMISPPFPPPFAERQEFFLFRTNGRRC